MDSTLKIGGADLDQLADFAEKLGALSDKAETNVTLSISADKSEIPAKVLELAKVL